MIFENGWHSLRLRAYARKNKKALEKSFQAPTLVLSVADRD